MGYWRGEGYNGYGAGLNCFGIASGMIKVGFSQELQTKSGFVRFRKRDSFEREALATGKADSIYHR